MSVSILEALQNANYNLNNVETLGIGLIPLIKDQLNNAIILLEKGYDINDEVEPLLEKYNNIENVPEKPENHIVTKIKKLKDLRGAKLADDGGLIKKAGLLR